MKITLKPHLELKSKFKMTMTMYKNIIRTAFLFATGIFMTACSSGDDELADSRTIVTPDTKENTVTLTGTISAGSDITRAVAADGTVSWAVGDEICVQYTDKDGNYATVKGTIKEVDSDTHKAKFTATLTNLAPNSTSNSIGLAYPYSNVTAGKANATDFAIKDGILAKQAGTIDGINNAKLDIAWTETAVEITIDKATATLKNDADLSNQVCICKFNIKDTDSSTELNARMLEITTGTNTTPDYIVTPANEQSTFYVVLPEISGNLKIEASTCGDNGAMKLDSENKLKAMKSTDVGKYISVDPTEGTEKNQAYLCTDLTSASLSTAKICKHTYTGASLAKDKFYEKNLTTTSKELTPIAVVSSVGQVSGYWDYFLALAINDVPTSGTVTLAGGQTTVNEWVASHIVKINGQTYDSFNNAAYDQVAPNTDASQASSWSSSNTASATVPAKWRVPSVTDWRYIIEHFGGRDATDPVGVMDYNGIYPNESTPGYTSGSAVMSEINTACGNSELQGVVYWASSQYLYSTNPDVYKTWRWDFAYGYFVWNSGDDTARIRLVLAY